MLISCARLSPKVAPRGMSLASGPLFSAGAETTLIKNVTVLKIAGGLRLLDGHFKRISAL